MKPALLFYCQHSVGLGHLMRSYALCDRLAERFRVVLIAGGQLPEGIAPPPGVEIVALLDLEHLALGPAAADVGQVVANLLVGRRPARAFLDGYGEIDRDALAWYTAASLLARIALPAIGRYRPELIPRLPRLLVA